MLLAVKDIWKVGLGFLEIGLAAVSHFLAGSLGLLTKQDHTAAGSCRVMEMQNCL